MLSQGHERALPTIPAPARVNSADETFAATFRTFLTRQNLMELVSDILDDLGLEPTFSTHGFSSTPDGPSMDVSVVHGGFGALAVAESQFFAASIPPVSEHPTSQDIEPEPQPASVPTAFGSVALEAPPERAKARRAKRMVDEFPRSTVTILGAEGAGVMQRLMWFLYKTKAIDGAPWSRTPTPASRCQVPQTPSWCSGSSAPTSCHPARTWFSCASTDSITLARASANMKATGATPHIRIASVANRQ